MRASEIWGGRIGELIKRESRNTDPWGYCWRTKQLALTHIPSANSKHLSKVINDAFIVCTVSLKKSILAV